MPCITVRGLLLADRPDLVAQTSHDHTHVLFNRVCGCHWKLLQNPAQITSLAPLWAGASVIGTHTGPRIQGTHERNNEYMKHTQEHQIDQGLVPCPEQRMR